MWRLGQVEVLQPEDEEPFILASVKSGQTRTSVDTYMFKAGAPWLWPSAAIAIPFCVPLLSMRNDLQRMAFTVLVVIAYS